MTWKDLEAMFNRSLHFSFSKRKLIFIVPVLLLCGVLVVFCRILALGAGAWVSMSLAFMPVFLCSGVLLATGIVLTRLYHNEVKQIDSSYRKVILQSKEHMVGVAYLSVPMVVVYLILWTILGIFYLLQAIPGIGSTVGIILSFGPFLLVVGSLLLAFLNLLALFFITPAAALRSKVSVETVQQAWVRFCKNPFASLALFTLGFFPLAVIGALLCIAAFVTDAGFLTGGCGWTVALQWFFLMLPFCAVLAPAIVFFFNFSVESMIWLKKARGLS